MERLMCVFVMTGVYQHHAQGYGHMQPTRSIQSSPHSSNMVREHIKRVHLKNFVCSEDPCGLILIFSIIFILSLNKII